MNVTIIGAGAFGTALGKILIDNQHNVSYFDTKNETLTLEKATELAEAIVIAIPSEVVGEFITGLPTHLRKLPIILTSKGLLSLEIFEDLPHFSVLSGPAFASELLAGAETTMTASDELVKTLFENEQLKIELTDDALGIALCGSLKNVYAIGAGASAGAENSSAAYIEQAHNEMQKYLEDHGARAETADLACGIGDLILTCTSEQSRNFLCGRILSEAGNLAEAREKLGTVEGLSALEQIDRNGYGVIEKVYRLVHGE